MVVQCSCCGATKVIIPSCLFGEPGIGARKKEKIILELGKSGITQKEIAEQFEVSEASVSRLKAEILRAKNTGPAGPRKTILDNFRLIRQFKEQQTRLRPELKSFPALSVWQATIRKDRFEFILRN